MKLTCLRYSRSLIPSTGSRLAQRPLCADPHSSLKQFFNLHQLCCVHQSPIISVWTNGSHWEEKAKVSLIFVVKKLFNAIFWQLCPTSLQDIYLGWRNFFDCPRRADSISLTKITDRVHIIQWMTSQDCHWIGEIQNRVRWNLSQNMITSVESSQRAFFKST